MEKYIATVISDWCLKKNSVTPTQEIAIRYGIELFLNSLLKILLILLIGTIFGKGIETIIVISCFSILRGEAGGIHMKSSLGCFLSMSAIVIVSVLGAEVIPYFSKYVSILVIGISLIVISLYAPFTTKNNPITDKKIIKQKKWKAMIVVFILGVLIFITKDNHLRALVLIPVIIEIITILPVWRRKEERNSGQERASE